MKRLDDYLKSQAAVGDFHGSGAFVVDYSKAKSKTGRFTLAKPEQWVIRLMQGFSRLGVTRLHFVVGRRDLTAHAVLPSAPDLRPLFRLTDERDLRFPLQDAVWGALNKEFQVEVLWTGPLKTGGFRVDDESVHPLSVESDSIPRILFRVAPLHRRGLLFRLFGKMDFSAEFAEIARVASLVPYQTIIDGRPYEFEAGRDRTQIRVQPAEDGLRIKVPGLVSPALRTLRGVHHQTAIETPGYRFMVKISWANRERIPLIHWIVDGVRVESRPLRAWKSHLWLQLYLPGDGFQTDLTRMRLVQTKSLQEHRRQLERLAVFSLLTVPPYDLEGLPFPELVTKEVRRFANDVVEGETYKRLDGQGFKNEIKEYQNRKELTDALYRHKLEAWEKEQNKRRARSGHQRDEDRFSALAGWAQIDEADVDERMTRPPKPAVKPFLGHTYIELERGEVPARPDIPRVVRRLEKR